MKAEDLTPAELAILRTLAEHGELLLDTVKRANERRMLRGKVTHSIQKNNWTENQARLNGLLNSMRSTLAAREHAKKKVEPIERAIQMHDDDVIMIRGMLDEFYLDMKASGRKVSMLEDLPVV